MKKLNLLFASILLALSIQPLSATPLSKEEIKSITKEAYIYTYPMMEHYKMIYVLKVWKEMEEKAFLSFQFNKDIFNERLDAFKTASLETMQQYLIEILDKNQLYVNFSEIEDETFAVSKEDKALNYSFYNANN